MSALGTPPNPASLPPGVTPDAVALPQALQQTLQPSQQGTNPQVTSPEGQAPITPQAGIIDPDLDRFFTEEAAPQTPTQHPGAQGYQPPQAPVQSVVGQQNPYAPTQGYQQPQFDNATLARIEAAQQQLLQAMQANAQGQAPAGAAPTSAPATPDFNVALEAAELTDEDRAFFKGNEARFQRLLQNYAKATIEPVLQKLAQNGQAVASKLGDVERNTVTQQQHTTRQLISTRIPDFETVLAQPQFATFLEEVVPEVGVRRGDILRTAVKRGDIDLIATHVSRYKQQYGGAPDGSQGVQAMQQPSAQPRAPQPKQGQPRRVVTMDTMMQAEAMMMKGQLAPEKFEKLVSIFREQATGAGQPQQTSFRPA